MGRPFLKASNISVGLAAFLVVGLSGCDGSNDSVATKQQKCKLDSYKEQHPEECNYLKSVYGNTNVNSSNASTNHNTSTSWVPLWIMLHSMNSGNSNPHSGYSYSSGSNSSKSSYFSTGGSHSGSSGGHSSGSSSGG